MHCTLLTLVLVVALSSSATLGPSQFILTPAPAVGSRAPAAVRGQRFELVDDAGIVRATLGTTPAGLPALPC